MPLSDEMRALVLWADNESPNLGVRALAAGTAELVRGAWPDIDITFQNYGSRRPQLPIGRVRSLLAEQVLRRRGMRSWLRSFDVIIDTRAGDSLTDAYGLHRLSVMTLVGQLATQAGVPVILGPQTVGPFTTARGRALARASLRSASVIMTRDSASTALVAELSGRTAVETADVSFLLPVAPVVKSRDVILNVSGLLWNPNPHVDFARYRQAVESIGESLEQHGRQVTLLAHVLQSGNTDSDVAATNALRDRRGHGEVVIPRDLFHARAVIAGSRAVIASRMHACLNALSVGVPAVPLAYSNKFEPLLNDLGWPIGVDLRSDTHPATSTQWELFRAENLDVAAVAARARSTRGAAEIALARVRVRETAR